MKQRSLNTQLGFCSSLLKLYLEMISNLVVNNTPADGTRIKVEGCCTPETLGAPETLD